MRLYWSSPKSLLANKDIGEPLVRNRYSAPAPPQARLVDIAVADIELEVVDRIIGEIDLPEDMIVVRIENGQGAGRRGDFDAFIASETIEREAAHVELELGRRAPDVDGVPGMVAAVDAEKIARRVAREEVQSAAAHRVLVDAPERTVGLQPK